MTERVLGLDIGGANLKAALDDGTARSRPFALWKNPDRLTDELRELVDGWDWRRAAVTMTAELCDCFETKHRGVRAVLSAVEASLAGRPVVVWTVDGRFVNLAAGRAYPPRVAASNWLAGATLAARSVPGGFGVYLDIGSTTTDIVPIIDGVPAPQGRTDVDRLRWRELVYTGVRRTPVSAVMAFEVMAELFATTLDVGLLLGATPEEPLNTDTADGRPATRPFAHARLARMLGGDGESLNVEATMDLARRVRERQRTTIADAVRWVARNHQERVARSGFVPPSHYQPDAQAKETPSLARQAGSALDACGGRQLVQRARESTVTFILAGEGEELGREVVASFAAGGLEANVISLGQQLGLKTSTAACAYAVAVLASDGGYGP